MKLTVGMATHEDFDGTYFTVQSLRMHAGLPPDAEILVVDNAPDSVDGKGLAALCGGYWRGSVRYVPAPEKVGTAAPRDLVFRLATGDVVMCIDCHVLLAPGAIDALLSWYADRPDCPDLVQGPMVYDDLRNFATRFDDVWRAEMWGTWGTDPRGAGTEPFEIPAMGLGLFACRKDAWLGFNPRFRGFGGEEWYLHEKYRRAGRKCWSLPGLKWVHRFRPAGSSTPYPLTVEDRAWNYAVGLTEIGIPLDRARAEFVPNKVSAEKWEGMVVEAKKPGCGPCASNQQAPPQQVTPLTEDWWAKVRQQDPGVELVHKAVPAGGRVVEFSPRRNSSTLAVMVAGPALFHSHSPETPPPLDGKQTRDGDTTVLTSSSGWSSAEPQECDLLVLHAQSGRDAVEGALRRHSPRAAKVVVAGMNAARESGEALAPLLESGWRVAEKDPRGAGYVLLTRDGIPSRGPGLWKRVRNYLAALYRRWTARGPKTVSQATLHRRMSLCLQCPSLRGQHCGECGCPVMAKASWPTEACPLGKWGRES